MLAGLFLFSLTLRQDPAADLIKAIEAIQEPPLAATTDEAIAAWEKSCDDVALRKGELIWKLYTFHPSHADVPKYLSLRWDGMVGHRKPCDMGRLDKLDSDLRGFLAKPQLPSNEEVALFWTSKSRIWRTWRSMLDSKIKPTQPEAAEPLRTARKEADMFYGRSPKNGEGAYLYYDLSQMAKGTPSEFDSLRALASRYPQHRLAPSAKARAQMLSSIGKPFPLRFSDVKTGKLIDIKDYRGKVVLLDFWATWCQPCRLDIENDLLKTADRLKDRGLQVIGISLDLPEAQGGKKSLLEYIEEKKIPWPNFYDGKGQLGGFATECGVISIPAQFLIDKEGILRSIDARKNREKLLEHYLGSN